MQQFSLSKPDTSGVMSRGSFGFKRKPLAPLEPGEFWRGVAVLAKVSDRAKVRLGWMIFYLTVGKKDAYATAHHFGIVPKTFYQWHKRFKARGVKGLEDMPRTPHRFRQWEVTLAEESQIKKLRRSHMHYGKLKLKELYVEEYGQAVSTWKIERVIRKHKLFCEPVKHDYQVKKRANAQPKRRIQQLGVKPDPWFLFHIDTIVIYWESVKRYIVTAIDHETRVAYARMYTNKSSRSAQDFLYRLHYLIQADLVHVHTDNGSEFAHEFDQALVELAATHWYSRPNTPKDNPRGERFNETLQYEWLNDGHFTPDTSRFNGALTDWLIEYNFHRPHQSLDYQRPFAYLQAKLSESKLLLPMSPASTRHCQYLSGYDIVAEEAMTQPERDSASGKYWKDHVLSWEAGAYFKGGGSHMSAWDRVSPFFRGKAMYVRMDAALHILAPHLKDTTILDIGCASGRFAFEVLKAGAKRVIGLDVAPAAIKLANEKRQASPFSNQLEFIVADVTQIKKRLPKADLVTALGVIEYFDANELSAFLGKLAAPYFLFDFPDSQGRKRNPWTWYLRQVYLALNRCPGVYLYSQAEFRSLAQKRGYENIWFIRHNTFDYVTNLPRSSQTKPH